MVVLATPQGGTRRNSVEGGTRRNSVETQISSSKSVLSFSAIPSLLPEPDSRENVGGRVRITNPRLDHLGKPKEPKASRVKYLRSGLSLAYDFKGSSKKHQASLLYSLMTDARKSADLSLPRLYRMHSLFERGVHDPGVTLVGPRAFRLCMRQMGIHDEVLTDRLFGTFSEHYARRRLDFRDFMRACICMNAKAPIEERLDLLFDVYDVDGSGTLSLLELTSIIAPVQQSAVFHAPTGGPTSPRETTRSSSPSALAADDLDAPPLPISPPRVDYKRMLEPETLSTLEQVWSLAREIQGRDTTRSDVWAVDARASNGVKKGHLLLACAESDVARDFFHKHLTMSQPAELLTAAALPVGAGDGELRHFYMRLTELDTEVIHEVHGGDLLPEPPAAAPPSAAEKQADKHTGGSSLPFANRAPRRRSHGGDSFRAKQRDAEDDRAAQAPPKGPLSPRTRARVLGVKRDTALTVSRRCLGKNLKAEADRKMQVLSDSAAQLHGTNYGEHRDKVKTSRAVDEQEAVRILKYLNRTRERQSFPPITNNIHDLTAAKKYRNDARMRASGYVRTPGGSLGVGSLGASVSMPAL